MARFLKQHLGAAGPETADVEALKLEVTELKTEVEKLREENKQLQEKVSAVVLTPSQEVEKLGGEQTAAGKGQCCCSDPPPPP